MKKIASTLIALAFAVLAAPTADAATVRYEYPASVQQARSECFSAERDARGIPSPDPAYTAWYEANRGNAAGNEWDSAYQGCKDAHDVSGTQWSAEWYANLVTS